MKRTLVLLVLASATAVGCGVGPADIPSADPHLRSYSVPHDLATEVRNALQEALRSPEGQPSRGRASLAPGGRLMVLAPPLAHTGVEDLFASLEEAEPPPKPSTIEITYWIVAGRAAEGRKPVIPNALKEVESVLNSTAAALGQQEFGLIERLQLSSRSDARAFTTGAFMSVVQRAYPAGGQIVAHLEINPTGRASLETEVKIDDGQTVVLAQTSIGSEGHLHTDWPAEDGDIVLYIIRAVGRS